MKYRPPRHPCDYPSEAKATSRPLPSGVSNPAPKRTRVVLRDVTPDGARLDAGATDLAPEDTVKLWIMQKPLTAVVRWVRGPMVGVRFTRRLSMAELSMLRHMPLGRAERPGPGPVRRHAHGFTEL